MPYEHDESQWPIVISRSIGESQDSDISAYIASHEASVRRGKHVVVLDASKGQAMNTKHRKQVADWIQANARRLEQARLGLALVSSSAVVRGIVTATYWLSPPPYRYQAFKTMDDAKEWARKLLAGAA